MTRARLWVVSVLGSIFDPAATVRTVRAAAPVPIACALLAAVMLIGLGTLPRQLALLAQALPITGSDASSDLLRQAVGAGLRRLIIIDRLVPPPTLVIAGVLLGFAADPILGLAHDRRRELWAVLALGMVPLIIFRGGELLVSWLLPVGPHPTAGIATSLPRQFATGLDLFWPAPAPTAIEAFSARLNLFSLWSVGIWAAGLRELDGGRFAAWHMGLPLGTLACAGVFTWVLEGPVIATILGRP